MSKIVNLPFISRNSNRYVRDVSNYTGQYNKVFIPNYYFIDFKIHNKYLELKNNWLEETLYESNPYVKISNHNYQKIIKLGMDVVPLLLNDLIIHKCDFFDALSEILKIDPIKPDHYGDISAMIDDWKIWKKENIGI